ncbi:lipopolysaccharide transport periplasmic protein LptA [Aquabacterium sp.]|uniref:lipopolysaccharide transport periplasmic protein LptA n=1 Tax=Aquabacterium sp. TaxID=1872578 RepID=UPI0025B8708F|nr:lipopolysaccharide transport periplasmic protein LptA [Aquabacterium sp.]
MPKMLLIYPNHSRLILVASLLAAMWAAPAQAEKTDRAQPLNFAADSARVDDAQRLNILSGNVEITKGSMTVHADRVEVRQNADGSQTATAMGGQGGRAYFKQKREGLDESIEGEAEKVVYEGKDDTVRFTGRAVMRRLKGVTLTDEVTGQTIIYDNKTSVFQVVGASGSTTTTKGRVRGVITPRGAAEPVTAPNEKGPSLTPAATLSQPESGR